jgi:hypothetical protein
VAKVLTTGQKREAVVLMYDVTGLSQRRASRLTGLSLSTCCYDAQRPATDAIYQGVLLSWRLNADVLDIGASGSCCVGRAITSITSDLPP